MGGGSFFVIGGFGLLTYAETREKEEEEKEEEGKLRSSSASAVSVSRSLNGTNNAHAEYVPLPSQA